MNLLVTLEKKNNNAVKKVTFLEEPGLPQKYAPDYQEKSLNSETESTILREYEEKKYTKYTLKPSLKINSCVLLSPLYCYL